MAVVLFPSYLDALIEEFQVFKKVFHRQEYVEESQNLNEFIGKLLNRLSVLLSHIDKQRYEVFLQGRYLPKKINQWAMAARTLKCKSSDILQKQKDTEGDSIGCEELLELGIQMINHLKKCPSKDELMYDKPIRRIYPRPGSGLGKQITRWEPKYKTEPVLVLEETARSLSPSQPQGVSVPAVEFEGGSSKTISITKSMLADEIIRKESSDVHEKSNLVVVEQKTLDPSSAEEMQLNHFFREKMHYSFYMKNNSIELELDHHSMSIQVDDLSSGTLESSPVNAVINLVEQGLCKLPQKPEYPNCLALFLQRNNRLKIIHPVFFNSLPDLRFLDLSDTRIRILPASIFGLSKLQVLLLRNCVSLDKIPPEMGKLSHLEVLDLLGSELYDLPDEIGELTRLKHMQLSVYGPDDESEYIHLPSDLISIGVLSKLKELEALSITVHPADHRWESIATSMMRDVGSLERLSFLQFYFPKVEIFEEFIQMRSSWTEGQSIEIGSSEKKQELKRFKFIVGQNVKRVVSRVPDELELLFDQQDCSLRFVNGDKVSEVIKIALQHATAFYLDHHFEIQSLSDFGISNFQALRFCLVRECPKIQMILNEETSEGAFPNLEYLSVYYLWELERIWKSTLALGNFEALKYLTVHTCPKLEFILWESMLPCLSKLKELVVDDCESVETIIKEDKKTNIDAVVLPGLRKVVLNHLPNLVVLGNGLSRLSEDEIAVHGCPKLIIRNKKCGRGRFSLLVMRLQRLVSKYCEQAVLIFKVLKLCLLIETASTGGITSPLVYGFSFLLFLIALILVLILVFVLWAIV